MDSTEATFCTRKLIGFLNDDDAEVRGLVADAFSSMRGIYEVEVRQFVEQFAASRALANGEDDMAEYLREYGADDPIWVLSVLETILVNQHARDPVRRTGGEHLVRLVLGVYTSFTADSELRKRAMDVFDGLMERYTFEAQRALDEWDQR